MSDNRLATLAHYVIWRCDPSKLGATKLNKILWFADVEAFRLNGNTISGADAYEKRPFGPVPKGILRAIGALTDEGKVVTSEQNYYGRPKRMFFSLARPDLSAFSGDEIAIIDMVADSISSGHTAESISVLSHDALWDEIEDGADIPISAAAITEGEVTGGDMEWARAAFAG